MGVILGGIPMVVIGFNKDVAWTHTVTTAVHFTTFRLALDPGDADRHHLPVRRRAGEDDAENSHRRHAACPTAAWSAAARPFTSANKARCMVKPEAGIDLDRRRGARACRPQPQQHPPDRPVDRHRLRRSVPS